MDETVEIRVTVEEAEARLQELADAALEGADVIICNENRPRARIVPLLYQVRKKLSQFA